jgi:hypothetical protein
MPALIDDIYGVTRIEERFEVSRAVYENVGAETTYTIYDGYGHIAKPAIDDLVDFHKTEIQATYGSTSANEEDATGESDELDSTSDTGNESGDNDTSNESGNSDTASNTTNEESPGFGIGAALSGIAGVSYVIKHRIGSES